MASGPGQVDRAADPAPVEPRRPEDDECCHSGCCPCVLDLYAEALEKYRIELRAWQERNGKTPD